MPTIPGRIVCTKHKAKESNYVTDSDDATTNTVVPNVPNVQQIVEGPDPKPVAKAAPTAKNLCTFKILKGERAKAGELCGANAKTGSEFCSRHIAKLAASDGKAPTSTGAKTKSSEPVVPNTTAKQATTATIMKHKELGVFYHKQSGFVFRDPTASGKGKADIVYGKIRNGAVTDLTDDDKNTITSVYKWTIEKSDEETVDDLELPNFPEPKKKKETVVTKTTITAKNVDEIVTDMLDDNEEELEEEESLTQPPSDVEGDLEEDD